MTPPATPQMTGPSSSPFWQAPHGRGLCQGALCRSPYAGPLPGSLSHTGAFGTALPARQRRATWEIQEQRLASAQPLRGRAAKLYGRPSVTGPSGYQTSELLMRAYNFSLEREMVDPWGVNRCGRLRRTPTPRGRRAGVVPMGDCLGSGSSALYPCVSPLPDGWARPWSRQAIHAGRGGHLGSSRGLCVVGGRESLPTQASLDRRRLRSFDPQSLASSLPCPGPSVMHVIICCDVVTFDDQGATRWCGWKHQHRDVESTPRAPGHQRPGIRSGTGQAVRVPGDTEAGAL